MCVSACVHLYNKIYVCMYKMIIARVHTGEKKKPERSLTARTTIGTLYDFPTGHPTGGGVQGLSLCFVCPSALSRRHRRHYEKCRPWRLIPVLVTHIYRVVISRVSRSKFAF